MKRKVDFEGGYSERPVKQVKSISEATQAKLASSINDLPPDLVEDLIVPAIRALSKESLAAFGATSEHMHAQVIRGTAIPLAMALRKQLTQTTVPSVPNDLNVLHAAENIIPTSGNLGYALYALTRLEKLFKLRGFQDSLPSNMHGPWRHEGWSMEQVDQSLQAVLYGSRESPCNFPEGLSEAFCGLKAATMGPLLHWQAAALEKPGANANSIRKTIEAVKWCAETQHKTFELIGYETLEIPPLWLYAQHIETLDIRRSGVGDFPQEISQLSDLRTLRIYRCPSLQGELFERMPVGLQDLSIQYTREVAVNDSLLRLVSLERLQLVGCLVASLPKELNRLNKLVHLDLESARLDHAMCDVLRELVGLKSLNLSNSRVSLLGDRPFAPENIETLNLARNDLTSVPESVLQLRHLRSLNLSENIIRKIDTPFDSLGNLKELNLSGNRIEDLRMGLAVLKSLERLDLSWNELAELPVQVFSCSALKNLKFDDNAIHAVPDMWKNLANLEELSLADNRVQNLGVSIGECPYLKKLIVQGNPIVGLSERLAKLSGA